jgi:hypothetical protein
MNRRRPENTPDLYYQEGIEQLHQLSVADSFLPEHTALYICRDCIQISLKLSESLACFITNGNQFLIKFGHCSAIGEVYRIDNGSDETDLTQDIYLRLIKRETSYPEWEGSMKVLKVRIQIIHYKSAVYKKILSSLRQQQLKKALDESRRRVLNIFPAYRALMNQSKSLNIFSSVVEEEDSIEVVKEAIRNDYFERQTFIFCTPSTERLLEFAEFCNNDPEMSKQTIFFPPETFISEKWKSETLNNIVVNQMDYDMTNGWEIEMIEHQLKFQSQEAAQLMTKVHPRIIMGTPASLILVMDGLSCKLLLVLMGFK